MKQLLSTILCLSVALSPGIWAGQDTSKVTEREIRQNIEERELHWRNGVDARKGLLPLGLASGLGVVAGSLGHFQGLDSSSAVRIGMGTTIGSLVLANALLPMTNDSWLLGDIYQGLAHTGKYTLLVSQATFLKAKWACKKTIEKIVGK